MARLRARSFVVLVLATARLSFAACGDDPGDAAAVAAARAAVDAACPCAAAATHGAHVSCARATLVTQSGLSPACRAALVRCASKSTCGRPGAVTCCRTRATGETRCSIKRSAARCTPPAGGTACVGVHESCCDACVTGGCAPETTTTTSTIPGACAGTYPACGGDCPAGRVCGQDAISPACRCFPDGSQPCGDSEVPMCNGTCPVGERCGMLSLFGTCGCVPDGATACGETMSCGVGVCPGGDECRPFQLSGAPVLCGCSPAGVACCEGGLACPTGQVCGQAPGICGCF
jgi:hypothetical protein